MSKITQEDLKEYHKLIADGYSQRKACELLGVARTTMQDTLKRESSASSKITQADNKVKVLYFDLETTLAKSYHFQQWGVNLSAKQKIQESNLLSIAWAFNNGDVCGDILSKEEVLEHDDERLILKLWCLLDNADIVVAHNASKFDIKKANTYFLKYGLNPPSPYRVVDTLRIAKKKFALPFNNLDYIANFLNVGSKLDTNIDLWIECDKGNQEALDKMLEYNICDVKVLRDVHKRLLTWDNNNVNMNTYNDDRFSCTNCGSDKVEMITNKFVHTNANKYLAYRCNDCGCVMRGNKHNSVGDKLLIV